MPEAPAALPQSAVTPPHSLRAPQGVPLPVSGDEAGNDAPKVAEGPQALAWAAFRLLPAAAAVLDVDGTVLMWNDAARALLGWSEQEVAGAPGAVPAWPDGALDWATEPSPESRSRRVKMCHRDGRRVSVLARTSRLGEGGVVLVMQPLGPVASARDRARPEPVPESGITTMVRVRRGDIGDRVRAAVAGARYLRTLAPGERLPAIREVAEAAGMSGRPVLLAYRALAADGTVASLTRRGTLLGGSPPGPEEECETGEWLVRALVDANALQMKVPQLAALVQRWTASVPLTCACVESCEDDLLALEEDVARAWGLTPLRVHLGEGRPAQTEAALRDADLVVTTPYHEAEVRRAVHARGVPVLTASLHPRIRDAVARALAAGPLTAVVADREFGRRLAGLPNAARLRVVHAADAEAVARLDPADAVLMTRAARHRLPGPARLLVAPAFMLAPDDPAALARVLVRHNRTRDRTAARAG